MKNQYIASLTPIRKIVILGLLLATWGCTEEEPQAPLADDSSWGELGGPLTEEEWAQLAAWNKEEEELENALRSVAASQAELEALTPEQAYQQGELLLSQSKTTRGESYLKYAADKGHVKAMHAYAMSLYRQKFFVPYEAYQYALKAAEQGNIDGMVLMIRHGDSDDKQYWRAQLIKAVTPGRSKGTAMPCCCSITMTAQPV